MKKIIFVAITRENAWEWCLENGFELIELDPEIEENSDEGWLWEIICQMDDISIYCKL